MRAQPIVLLGLIVSSSPSMAATGPIREARTAEHVLDSFESEKGLFQHHTRGKVVNRVLADEPQLITRGGRPAVYVVAAEAYEAERRGGPDRKAVLRSSPCRDVELELTRSKSDGRLIEDYWSTEWNTVVEDFGEIKDLGANPTAR